MIEQTLAVGIWALVTIVGFGCFLIGVGIGMLL